MNESELPPFEVGVQEQLDLERDKPQSSRKTALSDVQLFERRLLGRYLEAFDRFAEVVATALEHVQQTAERTNSVLELAERLSTQGARDRAVVQCFQNASWIGGICTAEYTIGEAILLGPETIEFTIPIEVDGPVEFRIQNDTGSFLVMTEIRIGERVCACGSIVRHCEPKAFKGQLFTIKCSKATYRAILKRTL